MFYVYVIKSLKTCEFYKGITSDVERRLNEHLRNKRSWLNNKGELMLIYVHICDSRIEARNWEIFFKSGIGREVIKELAEVAEWQTRRA